MKQVTIKLKTIYNIDLLVQAANKYENDLIIQTDNYIIDINSILGICTLNLTKPICIKSSCNKDLSNEFLLDISSLIINNDYILDKFN